MNDSRFRFFAHVAHLPETGDVVIHTPYNYTLGGVLPFNYMLRLKGIQHACVYRHNKGANNGFLPARARSDRMSKKIRILGR